MNTQRKTIFLLDNEVVVEERKDVDINYIENMKAMICIVKGCKYADIEVQFIETDLSEIDVTTDGMFNWLDADYKIYSGVKLNLIEGSDEYLDAINNGTVENYLEFN